METTNFSYPSKDGRTTIHAVKWMPENGEIKAIIQITHGMIEYIERYEEFAGFLTSQGYMVVGHDHVGHGDSIVEKKDWGFLCDKKQINPSDLLIEDMHTLRMMIQEEYKDIPYFMFAHSMGSYMLRKYLTLYNDNLRGAIICGTGYEKASKMKLGMFLAKVMSTFFGWRHISKIIIKSSFGGPYKQFDVTGKNPENSWLSKNIESVRNYYSDPKCTFKFSISGYQALFEAVLYDCDIENVKKTPKKLPLFIISGKDDPVGNMGVGVKQVYDLYKEAGSYDLTYQLYEDDRHEILNETDRQNIFDDILAWMNVRIDT